MKKKLRKTPFTDFTNPLDLPRMVVNPFRNRIQFIVELLLLRGTGSRLLVAAGLIALTAVFFGLLGFWAAMGTSQSFSHILESVWWAFLRLSDPGYLGDDEGAALRTVSTLVTVAGYVLFLGVLVAILTQGLNELIRKLEMGLTPISSKNHIILLGWSTRTPGIVRNFMLSEERVQRFLQRIGAKRLQLVLLVEEVTLNHTTELRAYLGRAWKAWQIILRSGSALRLDHLKRVDYLRASTIVIPAQDRVAGSTATMSDNSTIKTILSISHSLKHRGQERSTPLLVAELYDARKIPVATRSYQGPIEVVAGDEVVSRMVAQIVRHAKISFVYRELLTHGVGNEIFARDCPDKLVGSMFWEVAESLDKAILLGVTQSSPAGVRPVLNPPHDYKLAKGDKIVFLSEDWMHGINMPDSGSSGKYWHKPEKKLERRPREDHRVLLLGWSRRVPALLAEFESYTNQKFHVTIVSRYPVEERDDRIESYGCAFERTKVHEVLSDYTVPERLVELEPESFDSVFCLASDGTKSDQEADARTLVAYAILRDMLEGKEKKPRIMLELLDELNTVLVDPRECEYILTPQILSHILVQVSLRRELNAVFQELFNSSETEIFFRDFNRYGFEAGQTVAFPMIEAAARQHNEIALGVLVAADGNEPNGGVLLNPNRGMSFTLSEGDQFVVLRR